MPTKAEIRDRVLKKLGVLARGQTANAADASSVEQAYDELHAELTERSLAVWALTAEAPDKLAQSVVDMLAFRVCNDYAVSNDRYARLQADAVRAEGNMFAMTKGEFVYKPVEYVGY